MASLQILILLLIVEGPFLAAQTSTTQLNRPVKNVGAQRLHTVMERIMEEISFQAAEMENDSDVVVMNKLVKDKLSDVLTTSYLSKYIP